MRRLIAVTQDDDPQKPDFHFRLAELYAEKQRFYFTSARALDQKIFDAPPRPEGDAARTSRRATSRRR